MFSCRSFHIRGAVGLALVTVLTFHAHGDRPPKQLNISFVADFRAVAQWAGIVAAVDPWMAELVARFDPDTADLNGDFTVDLSNSANNSLLGNGILDAAKELGLLETVLNGTLPRYGVFDRSSVEQTWLANLERLEDKYIVFPLNRADGLPPAFVRILCAYITLGDGAMTRSGSLLTGSGSAGLAAVILEILDSLEINLPGTNLAISPNVPDFDPDDFTSIPGLSASPGADADGDGLSNRDEFQVFDNNQAVDPSFDYTAVAFNPDSDGDGMPDGFERDYGLDPSVDDSLADPDGDDLSNLEEFLARSDPGDLSSPDITCFVAPDGSDDSGDGSEANPWRTLSGALPLIAELVAAQPPTAPKRGRLLLEPAVYQEAAPVFLEPGVTVAGFESIVAQPTQRRLPCDDVPTHFPIVQGTLIGADESRLGNLILQAPESGVVLLDIDSAGMQIQTVVFEGAAARTSIGIRLQGTAADSVVIDNCCFTSLAIGLDIYSSVPTLRLSHFRNHSLAYIVLSPFQSKADEGYLGNSLTPASGYNIFEASTHPAVINERDETVLIEENEWDTDEASVVEGRIEGPADYDPFLGMGKSILAGAIVCSVWDAATDAAITNAAAQLTPSAYAAVTDNESGVYLFPAVAEGGYTVTVTASGYQPMSLSVTVMAGGTKSLLFPLALEIGKTNNNGCHCDKAAAARAGIADNPGDLMLSGLTVLTLLALHGVYRRRAS